MKKIFFTFCSILIFSFYVCADESLIKIMQKLESIERNISDLQKIVFANENQLTSADSEIQSKASELTVFDMRLRDIENELQAINFNYENISFEIDDLKNALEELTFELNNTFLELNDAIITINARLDDKSDFSSENTNVLELNESEVINETQDEQKNTLGTLKISTKDLSESNNVDESNEKIIFLSPEEQFQVAFDNLRGQKFEKAKSDFEIFIKDHSSHNLAGSAHYWLGELYLLKKEYLEAALVFAEGYQKYSDSTKSPEMLYKLAETYLKIEKIDEACRTFNQFILKYPNNNLINKSKAKISDLQCS